MVDALSSVLASRPVRAGARALRRRGALPRAAWARLPADPLVEVEAAPGTRFRLGGPEVVRRRLQWGPGPEEPETLPTWVALARRSGLVVDVGANLGLYALAAAAAAPTVQVVAVEPVPATVAALRANVDANGFGDRIEVVAAAATSRPGAVSLHVPGGAGSLSSMASLEASGFRGKPGDVIEVPGRTVDEVVAGRAVQLVKVDVEGFEHEVLRGMSGVLDAHRPAVVLECLPDGPTDEVEAELAGRGYRFWHLRRGGPEAVERIHPDPHEVERNVLALPPGSSPP